LGGRKKQNKNPRLGFFFWLMNNDGTHFSNLINFVGVVVVVGVVAPT
jgi:hypothetical protein